MSNLRDKHVVLGVTGGIACYKSADLASKAAQEGARVDVILTSAALKFISPLTFTAVTGRRAWTDMYTPDEAGRFPHVTHSRQADLIVIAPATANTIAKLAHGLADNLLTATVLDSRAPLLLAPAMETHMWEHPATQENVRALKERGVHFVGPEAGHLASGAEGVGRLAEVPTILGAMRYVLGLNGPLRGRKVVITAGGTREPIDPVRFITNPSTGKMGVALAEAARDLGATTVLVHAPLQVPVPYGVRGVSILTAQDMFDAVMAEVEDADVFIAAAAVADFRPARRAEHKVKKEGREGLVLELERTPDILGTVGERRQETGRPLVLVGFAAETENPVEAARAKLARKNLDIIIANDVTAADAGFAADTNRVVYIDREGRVEPWPLMSKAEVAERIIARVVEFGLLTKP